MSNKLYRPKRKRRKEKLSFIDKIEIGGITVAAIVLIGWSSWSVVDSFTPDPVIPSHEVYTDGISNYIAGLASSSDSTDSEDAESNTSDGANSSKKDTDDSKSADSNSTDEDKNKDNNDGEKTTDKKDSSNDTSKEAELTSTPEATETSAESSDATSSDKTTGQAAASITPTSYTAKDALNIRREPNENAQAISNYQAGDILNVTEDDSTHAGWLKVNKDGVDGYVSKDFVNVN